MKLINLILISILTSTLVFGQAEAMLKTADKNLKKYYLDNSNKEALATAQESIVGAFETGSIDNDASAQLLKGKIFNEVATGEINAKTLADAKSGTTDYKLTNPTAGVMAAEAFTAAHKLAEKKGTKREAIGGLVENESILNNMAIYAYQAQDFTSAYANFEASLEIADVLKAAGTDSRLADDAMLQEQKFFAAVCANSGGMVDKAKPLLMDLYETGYEDTYVYNSLFEIANEAGDDNALMYLEKGMKLDPDDTSLLFSKINYYLGKGQLNELIGSLKEAIKAEPDNITVYTTTGNVYDQLAAKAREDGDQAKVTEYFNESLNYYNQALAKDPENFDVNYSIGQLYYNKAAAMVGTINDLSGDISPAGMKAYDAKKLEMDGLFKQALPFFQKAEASNPEDLNTVIALKEIYARLNDIEMSNKYKAKYESMSTGN